MLRFWAILASPDQLDQTSDTHKNRKKKKKRNGINDHQWLEIINYIIVKYGEIYYGHNTALTQTIEDKYIPKGMTISAKNTLEKRKTAEMFSFLYQTTHIYAE